MTNVLDGTGGWIQDMTDYTLQHRPRVATIYGRGEQVPRLTPEGTPKDWDIWETGNGHSLTALKDWLIGLEGKNITHVVDDREKVHVWTTTESAMMLMFIRRYAPEGTKIGMYGLHWPREEYLWLKGLVDFYCYGLYMGPNWESKLALINKFDGRHPLIPFVSPLVQQKQDPNTPGKEYPVPMRWDEYEEALHHYLKHDTVIAWCGPKTSSTYMTATQAISFADRIEGATP